MTTRSPNTPRVVAAVVLLLGGAVLLGWVLDIAALKSVVPGLVSMKANTALGFILSGAALWLLAGDERRDNGAEGARFAAARVGRGCALLAALLGLVTLAEHASGARLGIDELLFRDDLSPVATTSPGRMAPTSAFCFLLIGVALLCLDVEVGAVGRGPTALRAPAQPLAVAAGLVALHALIGYLFGVSEFDGVPYYTRMAVHSAAGFLLLAVGVLFARSDRGMMAVVTADTLGGAVARRLLLAAVLVPPLIGLLRLLGERAGLYGTAYGVSISTVANVAVFLLVLWLSAAALHETDLRRGAAEAGLREANASLEARVAERTRELGRAEERLRAVVTNAPLILFALDREGVFTLSDGRALSLIGRAPGESLGQSAFDVYRHDPLIVAGLRRGLGGEAASWQAEVGGTVFETRSTPLFGEDGTPAGLIAVAVDVTERTRAEEAVRASESRYRTLAEAIPQLVWTLNPDGSVAFFNRRWEEFTGLSLSRLLDAGWYAVIHPDDRDRVRAAREEGAAQGEAYEVEVRLLRADGEYLWHLGRVVPLRGEGGAVVAWYGAALDIEERRRGEEALRSAAGALAQSERRFRATFEQAAVGIAQVAPDGSWLRVNQRLCDIVGYAPDELLRQSFQNITHPDDLDADMTHVQRVLSGEIDRYQMEKRYLRKDGGTVWINLTVSLVRDEDTREPLYFISVVEDVEDRKRAQREAEEQAELLRLSQDAIVVRRPDGTVHSWNPAAERLYGWPEAEARGRVTHDLLRTRFPESLGEQERTLLAAGHWEGELVHTGRNGRQIVVSSRQVLRRGHAKGSAGWGGDLVLEANRDVTEERRAREAERAAAEALRDSQARLSAVIDSAMDAIVTVDAEQDIVAFNPAAERAFGYAASEVIGHPLAVLLPERFRGAHGGHVVGFGGGAATNRSMGALGVLSARRKGGAEFPIEATISRVEVDGQTLFTAIVRDVTARVEAEQRQRFQVELGERVRPLIDPDEVMRVTVRAVGEFLKVPHCLFTEVDIEAGTVRLSAQYASDGRALRPAGDVQPLDLLATPEMIGRLVRGEVLAVPDTATDPLTAAVHGRRLAALGIRSVLIAPCLSGGRWAAMLGVDQETPREWAPEEVALLEAVAERTWRQVENARLFQEAQREVAERRRAESELRELAETLEERVQERTAALSEANASLESFNHVVAHDLRAPLRAMQGFAIALEEDFGTDLDEEARGYIGRIVDGADRMNALLSDLLAYSRLSRADLRSSLAPVSLDLAVADALRNLEADVAARGAGVAVEGAPLPAVLAHRSTLGQVALNLIGNALKFVPAGTPPRVRVWAERRDGDRIVRLWVEDNGIGIAPEHRERIWRVFERLHGIEQYPGTGVGLAIVAKAMERMGGGAGVESEVGRGSRFWIELPHADESRRATGNGPAAVADTNRL